jgi:hypothetical protein
MTAAGWSWSDEPAEGLTRARVRDGLMPHQVQISTTAPHFDMTRNFRCNLHPKLPTVSMARARAKDSYTKDRGTDALPTQPATATARKGAA